MGEPGKEKGHDENLTVTEALSYLRILGLSFSGKYRLQNGQ
jgi:hypothetical protein